MRYDNTAPNRMLVKLRKERGISQVELAKACGIKQATISRWETGEVQIPGKYKTILSSLLKTPESTFDYSIDPISRAKKFVDLLGNTPVLANVSAGSPEENAEVGISLSDVIRLGPRSFALKVTGDSMTRPSGPSYPNGSYVLIDPDISSLYDVLGRVVYAMVDNGEYTLKELCCDAGKYYLRPWNPQFPIIQIDINETKIVGVVRGCFLPE